jgi:hypothetical protein
MTTEKEMNELAEKYKQDNSKKSKNEIMEALLEMSPEDTLKTLRLMRAQRPSTFRDDVLDTPKFKLIYDKVYNVLWNNQNRREE